MSRKYITRQIVVTKPRLVGDCSAYLSHDNEKKETATLTCRCLVRSNDVPSPKKRGEILNVVIHRKLERVRPQSQRLNFPFTLVFDPAIDQALREYVTLQQEFVIIL